MTKFVFDTVVDENALTAFAELSGDFNPLHTDASYAAATPYKARVLHGAYAAGLVSRMAGMHMPGRNCLLHDMRLKFVAPIVPPVTLRLSGKSIRESNDGGEVEVTITDADSGQKYVDASYNYGFHTHSETTAQGTQPAAERKLGEGFVLVTGATGALGSAIKGVFGDAVIPISRSDNIEDETGRERFINELGPNSVCGAVHCGWPWPDNQKLINHSNATQPFQANVTEPLMQAVGAAALLKEIGQKGATLLLAGSTVGFRGRHMWNAPLYSIGKSVIPTLTEILAMELSQQDMKCVSITFDTLDGGMSAQLSPAAKVAITDKSPIGRLMSMDEAAQSIEWVLKNPTMFLNGATINLSGGAMP